MRLPWRVEEIDVYDTAELCCQPSEHETDAEQLQVSL